MEKKIPCTIMRGGTSKGIFLSGKDLPPPGPLRDAVIKEIMGTPDRRQINGLGGGDILSSKVAIIDPPTHPDADVDYTFVQVGIEQDLVSYSGNCGNISAAVGPFAIEAGLIPASGSTCTVKIHNTNVKKIIKAEVPLRNGKALSEGDFQIDGVPGSGAKTMLDFSETCGTLGKRILPTGKPVDLIHVQGIGEVSVSIVDVANPTVFVRARDIGMRGDEMPDFIESNKKRLDTFETIRGITAKMLGLVSDENEAFEKTPYIPFFCFISEPVSYRTFNGKNVEKHEMDISARLVGFKKTHKTFPGTGAACLGVASQIEGTVVSEMLRQEGRENKIIRIAHPCGVMNIEIEMNAGKQPIRAAFGRTWRKIMDGNVYISSQEG